MTDTPEAATKKGPSGSGSEAAWSVEARYDAPHPRQIAGHLLDNRWQQLRFGKGPHGVPIPPQMLQDYGVSHGYYPYVVAQALRWWFLAVAELEFIMPETRLVRYRVTYTYAITHEHDGAGLDAYIRPT